MPSETRRLLVALLLSLALSCWAIPAGASPAITTPDVPTDTAPAETSPDETRPSENDADVAPASEPTEVPAPPVDIDSAPLDDAPDPGEDEAPADPGPVEEEPVEDGPREVADAQLRWGINNEVNNRAFAPGTFNFMSAGKVGNPGAGATTLRKSDSGATWSNGRRAGWSARTGNVSLEKYSASAQRYRGATWAGLETDTEGRPIVGTSSGKFSGHQVVVDGGTGEIDVEKKTATIRWTGSFTVLLYSGMSFFYVTDPVLTVANGTGRITASLSGYGSSMDDQATWTPLPAQSVTLADLGQVDLTAAKGVEVTPRYAGVRVRTGPNQIAQLDSGEHWGAFPQSFVSFQDKVGAAAYWYSSGGSADAYKPAAPVTLSWSAGDPIVPAAPAAPPGGAADTVENIALQPPPIASAPVVAPPAAGGVAGASAPHVSVPPASELAPVADLPASRPVGTVLAAAISPDSLAWVWILGSGLLTLAAAIAAAPLLSRRSTRTS